MKSILIVASILLVAFSNNLEITMVAVIIFAVSTQDMVKEYKFLSTLVYVLGFTTLTMSTCAFWGIDMGDSTRLFAGLTLLVSTIYGAFVLSMILINWLNKPKESNLVYTEEVIIEYYED